MKKQIEIIDNHRLTESEIKRLTDALRISNKEYRKVLSEILDRIKDIFPKAQTENINNEFYTEFCDDGDVFIHVGGAYPLCFHKEYYENV